MWIAHLAHVLYLEMMQLVEGPGEICNEQD
jgi:hypothetical protein